MSDPASNLKADPLEPMLASAFKTVFSERAPDAELLPRLSFAAALLAAVPGSIDAPALLFKTAEKAVRFVPVRKRLRFGRAGECEISVPDFREVSRNHFGIHLEGDNNYILSDPSSFNGTFIRGIPGRITQRELIDGDIIDAAGFSFLFVRG